MATRPAERNGLGLSPEEVLQEVRSIEKSLTLLPDIPAIYSAWKIEEAMTVTLKLKPEVEAWLG